MNKTVFVVLDYEQEVHGVYTTKDIAMQTIRDRMIEEGDYQGDGSILDDMEYRIQEVLINDFVSFYPYI